MRGRLGRLCVVLCVVGAAGVLASSVGATPPDTEHFKARGDNVYDFPAGSVCPFDVSVNFVKADLEDITYSNGVERSAGVTFVDFTNVDAGKTRRLVEGGVYLHTPLSDDVVATLELGSSLSIFFPGDLGPGSPGEFLFTIGRALEVDQFPGPNPNPFGVTTLSFQVLSGTAENLCVTMA